MLKRFAAAIIAVITVCSFSSCTTEKRFDCSSLAIRLSEIDKSFFFDEETIFMSEGTYYIYYSFTRPSDILLTAATDSSNLINKLTLTLLKEGSEGTADIFRNFAAALTQVFFNTESIGEINEKTLINDTSVIFSDNSYTYENGKYSAVFFNSPIAASYILTYSQ